MNFCANLGAQRGLRKQIARQAALGLGLLLGFSSASHAVVTTVCCYAGTRTLLLRVGTATPGAIDTVQFDVGNSGSGNSLPTVANPHGNSVPVAANGSGVVIQMNMQVALGKLPQSVTTTVTSPVALTCASGGCGSASIPFSAISWTAAPTSGDDFQSGTFAGGTTQTIQALTFSGFLLGLFGGTADVTSTMNFSYANTTAYPAGNYSGTVVYTATLP